MAKTIDEIIQRKNQAIKNGGTKNTVVVNLFAGPGAGKTTSAWEIASKLKKRGFVAEYVPEYAKELVWEGRTDLLDKGSVEQQTNLLDEQTKRQNRLYGKVDFIITDSPTLLNAIYLKEDAPDYVQKVVDDFKNNNNFSVFIKRSKEYEKAGRMQTEAEAKEIDNQVRDVLRKNKIYFGTYAYDTDIDLSIENMIKTYQRTNDERSNVGYKIIDSYSLSEDSEVVIGYNSNAASPYVCWNCKNGNDYDTGYYTNTEQSARDKMRERIKNHIEEKEFMNGESASVSLTDKSDNISVDEYNGTWYVIDSAEYKDKPYFLLESEQYGDETANLIVDGQGKLVMEDVWNGFDDFKEKFDDFEYKSISNSFAEQSVEAIDKAVADEIRETLGEEKNELSEEME